MPLYDFRCTNKKCKTEVFDIYIAADDVHSGCACPQCNKKAKRVFTAAPFTFDFKAGYDPGLGKYMNSARERDTFVDKNNLRRAKD